jgi:multiple sugar transport system ATP-binding protein
VGAVTLGVRPEHFIMGQGDGAWEGSVALVERLGHDTVLYVNVEGSGALTVNLSGQHDQKVGDTVHLKPDPQYIHKFDQSGRPIKA